MTTAPNIDPPEKTCATCGRPFEWRRKWADVWHEVRYCSAACRRKLTQLDRALEQELIRLLAEREPSATCCPSEAARALAPERWRDEMERTRQAARRLAHRGCVEWTQKGTVVDPGRARGPVRIARGPEFSACLEAASE